MITTNTFISQSDWNNVVYFPANFDYDRLMKPCVLEAQQFDIRPALGKIFYDNELSKILDNGRTATVGNLTTDAYNNISNNLIYACLYFAHARYLRKNDQVHTRTGLVRKQNQYSEHVDLQGVERRARDDERKALDYIEDIKAYMIDNSSEYQTYFTNEVDPTGRETAVTFWTLQDDYEEQKPGTPTTPEGIGYWGIEADLIIQ